MNSDALSSAAWLNLGPVVISQSVVVSLGVTVGLVAIALVVNRGLSDRAGTVQAAAEIIVTLMRDAVAEVVPADTVGRVFPFIATLWLFIVVANLAGLVPGLSAPTRDLSVTAALACLVFLAVHAYGVRSAGWRAYVRHYFSPSPLLFPFHLISEFTRTLALAVRLFGNMMSLEMAALLVLLVAGFLVPVPLLLLHVVEALVQAYIFGMLALIYIGSAIEARTAGSPPPSPEQSP
jgi:F-type H+-transporting ATPase subunit a